jgi:hypothetical protein
VRQKDERELERVREAEQRRATKELLAAQRQEEELRLKRNLEERKREKEEEARAREKIRLKLGVNRSCLCMHRLYFVALACYASGMPRVSAACPCGPTLTPRALTILPPRDATSCRVWSSYLPERT